MNQDIPEKKSIVFETYISEILELISLDIMPRNDMAIYKLIKFYNDIKDTEGISSLLGFILDKSQK